jgi:hypothetical protein
MHGKTTIKINLLHVSAIQGGNTMDKTLKDDTIIEVTGTIQRIK